MSFGLLAISKRRKTMRAPANPLDKSTIVSIYSKEIYEIKHTIQPGTFHLLPGSIENPSILVVGPSSWWREIDEEQPLLEIPTSSIQIAESIVRDWAGALLGATVNVAQPGVFFVPGEHTVASIQKNFNHLLLNAKKMQDKWFEVLVRMADNLWARSNGNPIVISEDMRYAANHFGLQKDWMVDFAKMEMIRCTACGSLRNPAFPICPTCKAVVDPEKAKAMNLSFAS